MIYTTPNNVIRALQIIQHLLLKYIKIFFIIIITISIYTNFISISKANEKEQSTKEELIFAPNTNLNSLYPMLANGLNLSLSYGSNLSSIYNKIDSFIIGLEVNIFYYKSYFDWFGFLKNTTIKIDYSKVKLKSTEYSSVLDNFQFNINYNILNSQFLSLYLGAGIGDVYEYTLYINQLDEIDKLKQNLKSYSLSLGASFWLKPLGSIALFNFFDFGKYLNNAYIYIEAKQYNLVEKPIKKYIDTYRYEIYNIGIKYNFPLVKRYKVKSL
jgi:hypothetical protein